MMVNIIPKPERIKEKEGFFTADLNNVKVYLDESFLSLESILGVKAVKDKDLAQIKIEYSDDEKSEGYSLEIDDDEIEIEASDVKGAFYSLQSLKQLVLLSEGESSNVKLKALKISHDAPKYSWRGLHLDESRHFFGKGTVKKLLDFMALYKLNRFHWHLTDDQGWRIEIEKYPLLTEKGSTRKGSQLHHWTSTEMENKEVSGYYTKDDIREIVAYAKERNIEIIPEIDFPAHSAAAIACYNKLACREIECEVFDFFGGKVPWERGMKNWNRPICLGNDEALSFVFDVLGEVTELFPYKYFHVGGDESPTDEWKTCPKCQQRIKDENLKNEVELQGWFTNKVNEFLRSKGKAMVGWNEILTSDFIDRSIVAQYWTPKKDKNVISHLEKGGKAVLSCHKHFYFDMNYTYCKVKGTYSFTPKTAKINDKLKDGVLGLEAELWSEFIRDERELFFKLWHRGLALSENCWTSEKAKSYGDFTARLQTHKKIADSFGWYYGKDRYTINSNMLKKALEAKKQGFNAKYFDTEYRLNELK